MELLRPRVRLWGVKPVMEAVQVSIVSPVLETDRISSVSGGEVVGGENRDPIEYENPELTALPLTPLIKYVT